MTSLTWNDSPNQYVGNFRQYHYGGMPYYKAQAFQGGGGLGMTGGFMWRPFFAKLANLFMNKVVPTASKAFNHATPLLKEGLKSGLDAAAASIPQQMARLGANVLEGNNVVDSIRDEAKNTSNIFRKSSVKKLNELTGMGKKRKKSKFIIVKRKKVKSDIFN